MGVSLGSQEESGSRARTVHLSPGLPGEPRAERRTVWTGSLARLGCDGQCQLWQTIPICAPDLSQIVLKTGEHGFLEGLKKGSKEEVSREGGAGDPGASARV